MLAYIELLERVVDQLAKNAIWTLRGWLQKIVVELTHRHIQSLFLK